MPNAVVALFDSRAEAERAADHLMDAGFASGEIEVRSSDAGTSPKRESASWWDWLFGESEDRSYYTEHVARGAAVLTVMTSDELVERARTVLEAHGGEVEPARTATSRVADATAAPVHDAGKDEVIPVVEEQLKVGTRPLARTVRIYSRVSERPVEEDVRLRDERVRLERRPTDRPVEAADEAFRDRVFEMTESSEEVVIGKEARVVEEVVVSRDVDERVETVRDSVRRTDVEIEQGSRGDKFRDHWATNCQAGGERYEDYVPAYGYGEQLRDDPRYAGRDWASIEPDVQRGWEQRRPGTWDQFKASIRYAWDSVRGEDRRAA